MTCGQGWTWQEVSPHRSLLSVAASWGSDLVLLRQATGLAVDQVTEGLECGFETGTLPYPLAWDVDCLEQMDLSSVAAVVEDDLLSEENHLLQQEAGRSCSWIHDAGVEE